jgi:hypothetical protein
VNLWLPQDGADLSIYKRMLMSGAIKPFEMPKGIEQLAQHVMQMMEMAQASGRIRDAMKCAEILRHLAADNRSMAVEIDRIDRLDAGKPTTISSQVSPDVQDRIKRIVATQKARSVSANTEAASNERGHADGSGDPLGAVMRREQSASQASGGVDPAGRDHAAAEATTGERASDSPTGAAG